MIKNLLALFSTLFLCAILGEVFLRFVVDEVNFLRPDMMAHPVLRHAISPGSGGHDDWGFRNPIVPGNVQIVAIGDSQTYGTSAPASKSWPARLGRLSMMTVYNMAVGGYGPPDYRYLLNTKAKLLNPCLVLIGFYYGNDLPRSYQHAKNLKVNSIKLKNRRPERILTDLRDWLSRNSLTYQMSKFSLGRLIELFRFYEPRPSSGRQIYPVIAHNWRTILNPRPRFSALDQSKEANRIGLSETLKILDKTREDCTKMKARCVFVLIPTKITVYWPVVRQILRGKGYQYVQAEVEEEARVRRVMTGFLKNHKIEFVDPTEAMQAAARGDPLYPSNYDGHLNERGNEVLATEIFNAEIFNKAGMSSSCPDFVDG